MMHFFNRILMLYILIIIIIDSTGKQLNEYNPDNFIDVDTFITNESLSITPPNIIENSTNIFSSSSLILNVLSTSYELSSNTIKNQFLPSTPITSQTEASANSFIDQFNSYRNIDILSHIKQCDPNMKLNDICETYSIDNKSNLLIRQSDIQFSTLQNLSDALVDRMTIQKLNRFCLSMNWCLGNLSEDNIQSTMNVIREYGDSFCSLEQCHSRLLIFINSCPILSNMNVSIPTLKLLPMLCNLYNEQQNWNSIQCIEEIVYLLHIFYAFWPQLETCYYKISLGFDGCTSECQTFDNIFNKLENQCDGNTSFLSQVPVLAWYQSINLKEICQEKNTSTRSSFIYSIEKFFSYKRFSYHFYEKPLYIALFIIILICIVISFSLCFYFKSKHRLNSHNQQFDDNYEYTRLNNSTFELGTNTEIPNASSTTNGMVDDGLQFHSSGRFDSSEYQRLLYVNS